MQMGQKASNVIFSFVAAVSFQNVALQFQYKYYNQSFHYIDKEKLEQSFVEWEIIQNQ